MILTGFPPFDEFRRAFARMRKDTADTIIITYLALFY